MKRDPTPDEIIESTPIGYRIQKVTKILVVVALAALIYIKEYYCR